MLTFKEFILENTIDEGNFAHYVEKADAAKSKGDEQEAKHHLKYADRLYNTMSDEEKNKAAKHINLYKKISEEILYEAIKPYISGDHAEGWSILDSNGKEVKKFHHKDYKDHPIPNRKAAAKNDAVAYLKKNFDRLSEETTEEKKDPCWKNYKQLGMKNKGGKQVPNCVPEKE